MKMFRTSLIPIILALMATAASLTGCATAANELPPAPQTAPAAIRDGRAPFTADYDGAALDQWNDRTFYQIFVRSFYDSDGDGIGDLRGIIEKLDYLNDGDPATGDDLGVTGIWLMPINESPSYHGYDVTDYYSIESDYGTMDDFRELLAEAESRGIMVIMDLVLNHTSSRHPWFVASKGGDPEFRDYYVWEDSDPGTVGPWGQQVWHNGGNGSYYYGVFYSGMPDLNYWHPEVNREINEIIRFWLEDVGVDGFRLDAIMYLKEEANLLMNTFSNHEWFQMFHEYYTGMAPEAFTIGEVWTSSEEVARYVGSEVDTAFEFDLASAMLNSARQGTNNSLVSQQESVNGLYPEGQYGRFLSNHDQTRSATVLGNNEAAMRTAAALLLTGPGIPFIYYGEEIGTMGDKPDENLRRPMAWNPDGGFSSVGPWQGYAGGIESRNAATQTADPGSLLSLYRSLISLRNREEALRRGKLVHLGVDTRRIYSFFRYTPDESLLVLQNLGSAREDYALFLDQSPWADGFELELIYLADENGSGPVEADALAITQPEVDSAGGFDGYRPLAQLVDRGTYVFRVLPR
jgi:alpha-amylase